MVWGLRPKIFGGVQSETVVSSRSTTPVTPPVTRQVSEPTSQPSAAISKEPTTKAEAIGVINETKAEAEASDENAMDAQSTVQIRLEGDMILPLNERRPTTYADVTNVCISAIYLLRG